MSIVKVIYEDNHLIAVVKSAGVLSQADKSGDMSILGLIKKYLKSKYKKPGNVFVGLLHRLDRPVSGIMLFAKTSKGASRLSEQFRNHKVEKTYHAIVFCGRLFCGRLSLPQKEVITNFLRKDKKTLKARNFTNGKEVKLYYEIVKSNNKYSLLKIKIETGKFHQIRAQLSAAGFPILGDVKYKGPKWNNPKSIALSATGLSFTTATGNKRIDLKIDMPEEWSKYL